MSSSRALTAPAARRSVRAVPRTAERSWTVPLFALALVSSASLSFVLEPLFAKLILPLFGGAPAVWNTCVVFYQLVLVAGYLYAHVVSQWLSPRRQVIAQLVLMAAACLVLPVHASTAWLPKPGAPIVPGMLLLLAISIGLPFFAVSTIAPLLQRWFSRTGHENASDPYFLYAASNLGSFAGLIAYPVLIEPNLRLAMQAELWTIGYGVLVAFVAVCGVQVWRRHTPTATEPAEVAWQSREVAHAGPTSITIRQRVLWLVLAAVPSSLMLSVTTYASTDIAAVPLLWVAPLGLYLLTFVIAFAKRQVIPVWLAGGVLPVVALVASYSIVTEMNRPIGLILPLHLLTFFIAALVCHARLAAERPAASRLTEFYLWLSVGGALGGLFNVLVAPLVFVRTFEYPLAIALACLMRPVPAMGRSMQGAAWRDVLSALLPGLVLAALLASLRFAHVSLPPLAITLVACVPFLVAIGFWPWPRRYAFGVLGLFVVAAVLGSDERVLYAERTFFGTHRVVDRDGMHVLLNGTTNHGAQANDPKRRLEPLTYFGTASPIGQVFERLRGDASWSVGVVGLGTGTLAAYARPGEAWTFYEINPAAERIARDPRLFTFMATRGQNARVVIGDARLSLAGSPDRYDLLVLDAFSSDAIPTHLMTREAVRLYLDRLTPHGVMAFHISNRYLDLAAPLAGIAAGEGLVVRGQSQGDVDRTHGQAASTWVILARSSNDFGELTHDARWSALRGDTAAAWTDDFSNIWRVFHW